MKLTTTNLKLPRARWVELSPPVAATICVFALLMIAGLVGKIQTAPSVAAIPTPSLPIILIATSPAVIPPTAAPVQVAAVVPENVVHKAIVVYGAPDLTTAIGAVEAGRVFSPVARYGVDWTQVDMDGTGVVFVRTADLYGMPELIDLKPAPAPVVIERPIYVSAPSYAAPTIDAAEFQTANQPPADFYAPPDTSIEQRQQLIGSDPNALACGGSPLCGGMTNAEAQRALDAERATQR